MDLDRTQIQTTEDQVKAQDLSLRRSQPPVKVPGYDAERLLGEGAYGEVWVATERNTGRKVAVKFYTRRGGMDWSLLQREVEKLAFLSADRHVVQLIEVGWDSDPPYYVMEYLGYGSLEDRLEKAGALGADDAISLFREVAIGLMNAHGKGVLHCDLKPANVLLDQDDKPRLCDFGQARLSDDQTPSLGTLFYMAPEQADMKNAIPDARWDVYALGALLYCMLTGGPPHRTPENIEKMKAAENLEQRLSAYRQAIQHSPPLTEHRKVSGVNRFLGDIIDRCLAPQPSKRYSNVQAVLSDLGEWQRRKARRPQLILGTVLPLLLLLVVIFFAVRGFNSAIETSKEAVIGRAEEIHRRMSREAAAGIESKIDKRWGVLGKEAKLLVDMQQDDKTLEEIVDDLVQEFTSKNQEQLKKKATAGFKNKYPKYLVDLDDDLALVEYLADLLGTKTAEIENHLGPMTLVRANRFIQQFVNAMSVTKELQWTFREYKPDGNGSQTQSFGMGVKETIRDRIQQALDDNPAFAKDPDVRKSLVTALAAEFSGDAQARQKVEQSLDRYLKNEQQFDGLKTLVAAKEWAIRRDGKIEQEAVQRLLDEQKLNDEGNDEKLTIPADRNQWDKETELLVRNKVKEIMRLSPFRLLEYVGELTDEQARNEAKKVIESWLVLQKWFEILKRRFDKDADLKTASLLITNKFGYQIARAPWDVGTAFEIWRHRDYFHGQRRNTASGNEVESPLNRAHLSQVFVSKAINMPMVAFSVPLWNQDRKAVWGIVAMTVVLGKFSELADNENQDILMTLVDGREDSMFRPGALLEHKYLAELQQNKQDGEKPPAYHLNHKISGMLVGITRSSDNSLTSDEIRDRCQWLSDYADPVSKDAEEYRGDWLAAMSPVVVKGKPIGWVVVVQEKKDKALEPIRKLGDELRFQGFIAMVFIVLVIAIAWGFVLLVVQGRASSKVIIALRRRFGLSGGGGSGGSMLTSSGSLRHTSNSSQRGGDPSNR